MFNLSHESAVRDSDSGAFRDTPKPLNDNFCDFLSFFKNLLTVILLMLCCTTSVEGTAGTASLNASKNGIKVNAPPYATATWNGSVWSGDGDGWQGSSPPHIEAGGDIKLYFDKSNEELPAIYGYLNSWDTPNYTETVDTNTYYF
jgi:hypothetical protein